MREKNNLFPKESSLQRKIEDKSLLVSMKQEKDSYSINYTSDEKHLYLKMIFTILIKYF